MHVDPLLPELVAILFALLLVALALRALGQPHVVGYLLAGVVIGPGITGLISDRAVIEHVGAVGIVLLMFFIGMEVSPRQLARSWRVALLGTLLQVGISVGCAFAVGACLGWPPARSMVLGFVISLSSTAVVLKLLKDRDELDSEVGRNVLAILLAQDLALIPMLATIGVMAGSQVGAMTWVFQGVGGIGMVALCVWIARTPKIRLPLASAVRGDHELQVFAAGALALGLALVSGLLGLSTALGAFVAGMLVAAARETEWVHQSLEPFRVVFVALFFVSVGLLIDIDFLATHWWQALLMVAAVLATNNLINACTLRMLGDSWRDGLYAGALLAQIGEFSFLLAAVAFQAGIIERFGYQMTMATISLSLVLSPPWIALVGTATGHRQRRHSTTPRASA